jgi:heme/copper-type cytochrome/quinol oxidase subunit 4
VNKRSPSFVWVYWIVFVLALAVTAVGVWLAVERATYSMLAAGCASVVGVLITWPIALHLRAFHCVSDDHAERAWTNINERFEQFSIMLNLISEQQLLSDRAKSVAFRDKDADALRRAIQEEMLEGHWEAASSLANEMERQFGFKKEADGLRREIAEKHTELNRKQVADALALIDRYVRAEAWPDALREAQRIAAALPDNQQAAAMPHEVEQRREAHKKQLIGSWNDSVARHDVDGAIEILKRLDAYLSPTEAEAFTESARGIFKEKLNLLRAQFAVAAKDENWSEALRLADAIIRDFPNTQMAKEVHGMMDSLRARAAGIEPEPAQV